VAEQGTITPPIEEISMMPRYGPHSDFCTTLYNDDVAATSEDDYCIRDSLDAESRILSDKGECSDRTESLERCLQDAHMVGREPIEECFKCEEASNDVYSHIYVGDMEVPIGDGVVDARSMEKEEGLATTEIENERLVEDQTTNTPSQGGENITHGNFFNSDFYMPMCQHDGAASS
jgi:hypothetical protein